MNKFFGGPFNRCTYRCRYVFVLLFTALGIGALFVAVKIAPLSKQEEFLPFDHQLMVKKYILENHFSETANSEDTLNVKLHWGIKGLDRSQVGIWDPADLGTLIWDEKFSIYPRRNQQAILDLCKTLRERTDLVQSERVQCWLEDFDEYV